MEIYNSRDIKLGILRDIKKQVLKEDYSSKFLGLVDVELSTSKYGKNTRGIIFEETDTGVHDVLYPELNYPFREEGNHTERTFAVERKYESLTPLLNYFSMESFTTPELEEFVKTILARKKWLRENEELFGVRTENYGLVKVVYNIGFAPLPRPLYEMLNDIQSDAGFSLTKREQKILGRRK